MYPACCENKEFIVVQWNPSGFIRFVLWGGGNHVLSLGIERIYSTAKRGFLIAQHYVRNLDELRYDVRRDSGLKRFDQIQGVANVGGIVNVAGA